VAELPPNCAGRLMAEELSALEKALGNPQRPVVAVVGGKQRPPNPTWLGTGSHASI
jgi:3-phosphoglycerate kinase